jgi:hypothetical protein
MAHEASKTAQPRIHPADEDNAGWAVSKITAMEAREWRIRRITQRLRARGSWHSFADIAERYSRESGSIIPDEGRRAEAYRLLCVISWKGISTAAWSGT